MAPNKLGRTPKVISSLHFWVVVALFAISVILHYPQQILSTDSPSLFSFLGMTRHAMERVFLLLPVSYAAFFLGTGAGLASLVISLGIMLPRVFLISLYLPDALFEVGLVTLIGGLVNLGFRAFRREWGKRQWLVLKLVSAEQQVQSQVRAIERSENWLSTLHKISTAICESLELGDVLDAAATRVRQVMDAEIVTVFLLDEENQELELRTYQGVSEEFVAGVKRLKVGESLNGQVAETGEPLLVQDVSLYSGPTAKILAREGINSMLIVPMKAKGRVVGTVTVATRSPRLFSSEEADLLCHVANHVGVCVENSHLYEKQRLMAEQIARDAAMEKQMQESLRFYLRQVTRAQEDERKRIARELHDDTAQELVALSRQLDGFITTNARLSAQDISYLEGLIQRIDKILGGIRRFCQDLRPSMIDDLGLAPALEWLTSDLTDHFGIPIAVGFIGPTRRLPSDVELVLFRIAQEALRNVGKHAEASRAWVTLEFGGDKVILTIKDNGKGFRLPKSMEHLTSGGKLGLAGMLERAQLIEGRLTIESEPGEGTTITVEVPDLRQAAASAERKAAGV